MTCDEYRRALLAGESSPAMDAHVAGCEECARADSGLRGVHRILADEAVWQPPSGDLESRVLADMAGGGADDRPVSLRPVAPAAESPIRRVAWLGAAAVSAAAVVALALAVLRPGAPDWEVALVGGEGPDQATATVTGWNTDAGTRMRLDATGLPVAPEGHLYEVWLSRDGVHISAGSFRAGEAVEMWIGVRRSEFPRIWVTLEPIDEDPYPSTEVVLDTASDA